MRNCIRASALMLLVLVVVSGLTGHSIRAGGGKSTGAYRVYIGTYTQQKSKGIYLLEMNAASGALTAKGLVAETENPTFLALHPSGRSLYAVNEIASFKREKTGAVSAFAVEAKTGKLTLLNQQASGGGGPCHLVLDRAGKNVLLANYGGGSVASLPIADNGELKPATSVMQHKGKSINPKRQEGPHAHSINLDAANRFAFVADLGLDKVLVYRFDAAEGKLIANDPPAASVAPGAGPRHFAFHPSGKFAYVINELHSTVTVFGYDAERGLLKERQTIATLPKGFADPTTTAEVVVHPTGKFLYGSNRGHDSIVVFAIDLETGRLTHVEHQNHNIKTPRNFAVDPAGKFLLVANQRSGTVIVFRIDPKTGSLQPTQHSAEVPTPVCIRFWPMSEK
jgi:6-phosphogluconolactonase